MDRVSFCSLILFTTLTMASCNSIVGDGEKSEKEYIVLPSITEYSMGETVEAIGVNIYEGDSLLATSTEGGYSFSLTRGEHLLELHSPFHHNKSTEINLSGKSGSFYWNEELDPIYGTFFPMTLNNSWRYSYKGYVHTDRYENEYEGFRNIEITDVITEGEDTLFTFITTDSITAYLDEDRFNENQEVVRVQDTTFTERTYLSVVRKKSDNRLIVESDFSPFFGIKNWLFNAGDFDYELYSSYPLSRTRGDTLYVITGGPYYYPNITILNGTGIVSYNYNWGHLDHGFDRYNLVEKTLH